MSDLNLLHFSKLSTYRKIKHFSTTRKGGQSQGVFSGLNLGYSVEDNTLAVTKNRDILAVSLDIKRKQMVFPKQTHSSNIGIVETVNDIFPDTDALITNLPEICICVQTADCVPILLYDPTNNAIAAIHSGWKGTVNKISKLTIELMNRHFGTNPDDVIAGIGPSVGPDVYEVGLDVIKQVNNSFEDSSSLLTEIMNSPKAYFNLWKAIKLTLLESNIREDNIELSGLCTLSNSKLFFSARRDGRQTGRMATGIMIHN